jgi:hypothetical protein
MNRTGAHPSIMQGKADGGETKSARFPHTPDEISAVAGLCMDGGEELTNT